jgi:hypothetical protein
MASTAVSSWEVRIHPNVVSWLWTVADFKSVCPPILCTFLGAETT